MEKILNISWLAKGSQVLTENGYVKIEDLKENDIVLTHENEYRPILELQTKDNVNMIKVTTLDSHEIIASPNQFVMVSNQKKGIFTVPQKKMISKLNKDDFLVSHFSADASGQIYYQYNRIKSISTVENTIGYNLIVDDYHTYIVDDKIIYDNTQKVKNK